MIFIAIVRGDSYHHENGDPLGCGIVVWSLEATDMTAARAEALAKLAALDQGTSTFHLEEANQVDLIQVGEAITLVSSEWKPIIDERRRIRSEETVVAQERYERSQYERLKKKFEPDKKES